MEPRSPHRKFPSWVKRGEPWQPPSVQAALPIDPSWADIRHLCFIYSLGIGGVERAVLSMLATLPLGVRQATGIVTVAAGDHLPMPEGVRHVHVAYQSWPWIAEAMPALRTVIVQPFIGMTIPVAQSFRLRGARMVWFVCTQSQMLIDQGKALSPEVYMATSDVLAEFCSLNGMAPCSLVPHYVADAPFSLKVGKHRLGYVGRNSLEKNSHLLPLVLLYLPESYSLRYCVPKVKAPLPWMSNDYLDRARKMVTMIGAESRVHWTFDETDEDALYRDIDVLLLPSWYEGYSLVAHEALVRGIPVVCSDHLLLCREGNPGVVGFPLPQTGVYEGSSEHTLTESAAQALVTVVPVAEALQGERIWQASQTYSRAHFERHYLGTLMRVLREGE